MDGLTEGRIVHFVLPNGEHRPAMVVRVFRQDDKAPADGKCNLQVFLDGTNDTRTLVEPGMVSGFTLWATSKICDPSGAPGTWHWIEKA